MPVPPQRWGKQKWWPNQLNLNILNENNPNNDPMDADFGCAAEFASLDFDALKADLAALMTDSQDCGLPTTAITARSSSA